MTLAMPDSINVDELPPGYPAYLGYVDGAVIPATCAKLAARFPAARRICLTTTGQALSADGVDCEPGNVDYLGAVGWVRRKLAAAPQSRPIVYADLATPGFSMNDVLNLMHRFGVDRSAARLLTAHWTHTPHICGPASCGELAVDADGTQWTDAFPGLGGAAIDMSQLRDDFFGPAGPTWTERLVRDLPVVRQGDTGEAVRTVQGLCNARGFQAFKIGPIAIDGIFGQQTSQAVRAGQAYAGIPQDGVVGPLTWPVLLGITP